MRQSFLIYGAYGYTGALTARLAVERGLSPVLAGRDAARLKPLANQLDLEYRVFGIEDTAEMERALSSVYAVLNCAGPFLHTHKRLVAACLRTTTHYLDITGEIPVYSSLAAMGLVARDAGIMLLPGIGFDVVPTDCLAADLKRRLPAATSLALAIYSNGPARVSRGTAKTFIEGLSAPVSTRVGGAIVPVPHVSESRVIDFGNGPIHATLMTLGDVFTAHHSTGIPNIKTYVALPSAVRIVLRLARPILPLLSRKLVLSVLRRLISAGPVGPTDKQRRQTNTYAWGEVEDDNGNALTSRLRLPEAYTFTALASIAAIRRVLSGDAPIGYQTPSSAYGPDFVFDIDGVERLDHDLAPQ